MCASCGLFLFFSFASVFSVAIVVHVAAPTAALSLSFSTQLSVTIVHREAKGGLGVVDDELRTTTKMYAAYNAAHL